jgi:hypothetical protein
VSRIAHTAVARLCGLPPPWPRAPLALQSLSEGFQRHVGHAVCLPQDAAQSLLACHRDDHAARADQTCAPGKERFVADSPLEEPVTSEPVSETEFPASWENTGNFVRQGLRVQLFVRNPSLNSMPYAPIPYASEQGIYFGLAGN